MNRAIHIARACLLASGAGMGLSACANTVILHYAQPANCFEFHSNLTNGSEPDHIYKPSMGMFEFYKVTQIENKGSGAVDFMFDPKKLYARSTKGGKTTNSFADGHGFANLVTTAHPQTVAKGTTASGLGQVVIDVATDDPTSETTAQTDLLYKSTGKESVLMTRDPGPQPKFINPCTPENTSGL